METCGKGMSRILIL
uniref:Uncharacterized protein n=1 Tax=Arundo donax TaxID=35708 RepID=A0A0A8ZA22_ARUDO